MLEEAKLEIQEPLTLLFSLLLLDIWTFKEEWLKVMKQSSKQ